MILGALYGCSDFTKTLTDPNGINQFAATQTAWMFVAGLAIFALVMLFTREPSRPALVIELEAEPEPGTEPKLATAPVRGRFKVQRE